MEPWRAALARWGEPLFGLAVVLTNQRAAAESALVAAFCRVFTAGPGTEPEIALYTALASQRLRLRRVWHQGVLPRRLARMAPRDRLLLGLWLLRNVDGTRLAAIAGESPQTVVARLARAIARTIQVPVPSPVEDSTRHLTLTSWLERQLGLAVQPADHEHTCERCQAAVAAWQQAIDMLRATLYAAAGGQRLPPRCVDAIEAWILEEQHRPSRAWWQQRRLWGAALIAGIGVLLVLLMVPRDRTGAPVGAPLATRDLVQATLDGWTSSPASGTLHRRVRAVDTRLASSDPMVTDVWTTGADSSRHRVEVRRGNTLVEWQVADGATRFDYATHQSYSACPWNLDFIGMHTPDVLSFRLSPEEQRAVRDARLMQGAYGTGYDALRRALAADDLRSFGMRSDGQRSLVVLSYTDAQFQRGEQIILHIDPVMKELYAVQAVAVDDSQTNTRDLWRLQSREELATDVPTGLPRWSGWQARDRLIDPACPALAPEHVISLRALVGRPWQQWYLPQTLPPGITRAAVIAASSPLGYDLKFKLLPGSRVFFIGPGRWLSLSPGDWGPNASSPDDLQRGAWHVDLSEQTRPGVWQGVLRFRQEQPYSPFVPTVELSASGWTQDELLALVDMLEPVTLGTWIELHDRFLDAQAVPAAVEAAVERAYAALQPQADRTLYSVADMRVRAHAVEPQLSDPYHLSNAIRNPTLLRRQQWLVYSGTHLARFYDIHTLPNSTLYKAALNDGTRFVFDYRADGWIGSEPATETRGGDTPEQPGIEMLATVVKGAEPITLTAEDDGWRLEQPGPRSASSIVYELFSSELPVPATEGLLEGHAVRRLWLDRTTYLPRRLEVVWRDVQGRETRLHTTVLNEHRSLDAPPAADRVALPPPPEDVVRFNSTFQRWRRARVALPPLSIQWLMANLDTPGRPVLVDPVLDGTVRTEVLAWPDSAGAAVYWRLLPVAAFDRLTIGTLRLNSWYDLSWLPVVHRTQYRMAPGNVLVTLSQGPRNLLQHILRYSLTRPHRAGLVWTSSERIPVTLAGEQRDAWLLQRGDVAALVVEVDDVMVHITGPVDYLRGPLLEQLPKLVWSEPE